jgi:hypothetical protein
MNVTVSTQTCLGRSNSEEEVNTFRSSETREGPNSFAATIHNSLSQVKDVSNLEEDITNRQIPEDLQCHSSIREKTVEFCKKINKIDTNKSQGSKQKKAEETPEQKAKTVRQSYKEAKAIYGVKVVEDSDGVEVSDWKDICEKMDSEQVEMLYKALFNLSQRVTRHSLDTDSSSGNPSPGNHYLRPVVKEIDEDLNLVQKEKRRILDARKNILKKQAMPNAQKNQSGAKPPVVMINYSAPSQKQAVSSRPISELTLAEVIAKFCQEVNTMEKGSSGIIVPVHSSVQQKSKLEKVKASHAFYKKTKDTYSVDFRLESAAMMGQMMDENQINKIIKSLTLLKNRIADHRREVRYFLKPDMVEKFPDKLVENTALNEAFNLFYEEVTDDVTLLTALLEKHSEGHKKDSEELVPLSVDLQIPSESFSSSSSSSSLQPSQFVENQVAERKRPSDDGVVPPRPVKKARTSDPLEELAKAEKKVEHHVVENQVAERKRPSDDGVVPPRPVKKARTSGSLEELAKTGKKVEHDAPARAAAETLVKIRGARLEKESRKLLLVAARLEKKRLELLPVAEMLLNLSGLK